MAPIDAPGRDDAARPSLWVRLVRINEAVDSTTWLAAWGGYVLALLVGRVLGGGDAVDVGDLTFGFIFALVISWLAVAGRDGLMTVAVVSTAVAGVAVGLFA